MSRRVLLWPALIVGIALASSPAASAASLQLVKVGTFASPTYVTAPRGDTARLFVVERAGRIQVLDNGVKHQFLDISNLVSCCVGERGLASMAFAPDYDTSGRFYVQYTALDPVGAVTIAEYQRSASDPDTADPASARILLSIPHDWQSNHNGGQLQFGPDGYLYSGVGDGGSGGDPAGNGQNLTSSDPPVINSVNHNPLLGKILRIDPRSGSPYSIPAGNPFPAPAREVFAYGLRNPWRFSFDRLSGDLVIGDVGQDAFEEVDMAASPDRGVGANYGWNKYEGLHTYPDGVLVTPPFPVGYTFPLVEHSHAADGVCSIIGGYVVRDPNLPELAGQYVYGDLCNSALRAVTLTSSGAQDDHPIGLSLNSLDSFGEDACARVYAISLGGEIDRLSDGAPSACTAVEPFPDTPLVSVSDVSVPEGDAGSAPASFVVSLSGPSTKTVTVHAATTDGTATAPADYTSTSGDLSFAPGQTSKTIDVPVQGDTLDEDDENFSLDLSNAVNASIGDGRGVATIVDDDPAPSVSISGGSVREGDSGTATLSFTASLSAPSGKRITVDYATADGTAQQPGDYQATSGSLTFAPGDTTAHIDVPVVGDTLHEGDETLAVDLANPANATLGTAHAVGTVVDDDPAPSVSIADASVVEGDSGTTQLQFAVSLSAPSGLPVSVAYATADGTATAPGDYTAAVGTVAFAAGETTKTVSVTVKGDTLNEGDETLTVGLSNPDGATIADGTAVGTITDDDPLPALSISGGTVTEGDSGSRPLTFTVRLSAASGRRVTVDYHTVDGTADAPGDYTATSGTLEFDAGETAHTVSVPVVGDTVQEGDETFTLVLASPSGATLAADTATGTIQDDDGLPSLSVQDAQVSEGGSSGLTAGATPVLRTAAGLAFAIELERTTALPVTVHYATADGTAHAPADYTATSGDVTFAPGQTVQTVVVPVIDDTVDEDDETLTLELSSPVNATLARSRATGTIVDDDAPPALTIADVRVREGDAGVTPASFAVSLSAPSEKAVRVAFATVDGAARAPADYTATSGTLTLAPGQQTAHVDVPVVGDTIDEDDQTFTVTLASPDNATLARAQATGTIVDDDAPPTVSVGDANRREGDAGVAPMTFTVSLSAPSEKAVTVHFATSDGTATGGTDYVAGSGTVTFAPGETSRTVAVGVVGDRVPEFNETFKLGLAGQDGSATADHGTGTILDDDPAATRARAPRFARIRDILCAHRPRRPCRGLRFSARYGGAGAGIWRFESRAGRRHIKLGVVHVRSRAAGRRSAVFRLRPGRRTAKLRRRVLAQRHPVLYATLSFKAASGKRATLRSRTRLRH